MSFAIAPSETPAWIAAAVRGAGGDIVPVEAADALIWYGGTPESLETLLAGRDRIRWVQLPTAGVEAYSRLIDDGRTWTCAKGAFSQTVTEQALALTFGLFRNLKVAALSTGWTHTETRPLAGSDIVIVGGGGIGETLALHLAPMQVRITAVRRDDRPVDWAIRTVTMSGLHDVLGRADVVYLAVPLVPELEGLIGERELRAMQSSAILVNVARGRHVVTDDLVRGLQQGWLAGAGLDVTDPEPLPDGHPLWSLPNCLITSHSSNSQATFQAGLAERIAANVARFRTGRSLLGIVDPTNRY